MKLVTRLEPWVSLCLLVAWVGIVLCGLALVSRERAAKRWLLFVVLCVVFALGPSLKVLDTRVFTKYELPIILPCHRVLASGGGPGGYTGGVERKLALLAVEGVRMRRS